MILVIHRVNYIEGSIMNKIKYQMKEGHIRLGNYG